MLQANRAKLHLHIKFITRTVQHLVHISPAALDTAVLTVALCLIELLVQSLSPPLDGPCEESSAQAAEQNQTTTQSVERLLASGEEVRRVPMRALTDTVGNGNKRCFLAAGSRYKSGLPGQLQVETVVCSGNKQNGTKVAGADIFGRNHDRNSYCGEGDRDDYVVG
jgi:hypothetical protein